MGIFDLGMIRRLFFSYAILLRDNTSSNKFDTFIVQLYNLWILERKLKRKYNYIIRCNNWFEVLYEKVNFYIYIAVYLLVCKC